MQSYAVAYIWFPWIDSLTSILAVLGRSCPIFTTSWQPWIPWQDSYQDLTKITYYSKNDFYHDGQNSMFIKNTIHLIKVSELQSEGSFHPTTTISSRFRKQCFKLLKRFCLQNCAKNYDNVFRLPKL